MLTKLKETFGVAGAFALMALFTVGEVYWLWMAVNVKSFIMFFLGFAGPFFLITAPVGAYSLLFGMPYWIRSLFG